MGRHSRVVRGLCAGSFGLASLVLVGTTPTGCGTNNAASKLTATPEFVPEGQAKCSVSASQEKPLIVEWPSGDRTDLEVRTRQGGLVVVRYEGCVMRLLPRCTAPGAYAYIPVTVKQDTIVMQSADELYANIPAGAAKFEAKLASAGQLNVAMMMVGKFAADRATVVPEELEGSCDGATHVVVGMNVGAFEFFAGSDGEIGAGATVASAGAGAKSTAKRETLTRDGDTEACLKATLADETPPAGCGASLRLEVIALETPQAAAAEPVAPRLVCPAGTDLVDGMCQPKVSKQCPEGMRFQEGQGCIPNVVKPTAIALPTQGSPTRGPADAPVVIQWFGEYQDPFTRRVSPTIKQLEEKLPGKIQVVFRQAPLAFHTQARQAAYAALEAYAQKGNAGYWKMHDALVALDGKLELPQLQQAAREVGLDMARFDQAMSSETHKAKVDEDFALFNAQGFRGVPSFMVGKEVVNGAQPLAKFEEAVALVLGGNDGEPGASALAVPPDAPTRGPKDARVTIQWFGAFHEPFTAKVAPTIHQLMSMKEYKGKIRLVWRNNPLPFHQRARPATYVALEAHAQGRFWDMFDILMENKGKLEDADLLGYAKQLRLDVGAVETALATAKYDAVIERDKQAATEAGAKGVPTFFINGVMLSGAQPIEKFREAVDEALGR